jgi:hypothetical protein
MGAAVEPVAGIQARAGFASRKATLALELGATTRHDWVAHFLRQHAFIMGNVSDPARHANAAERVRFQKCAPAGCLSMLRQLGGLSDEGACFREYL